jgi:hypothetical protein
MLRPYIRGGAIDCGKTQTPGGLKPALQFILWLERAPVLGR